MFSWTLKTLWQQRWATLASAGGVAGALLLVFLLEAVFLGESRQIIAYIEHTSPDVWVMQSGVSNMHMATSFVWDWKVDDVAHVEGAESVSPILYANTAVHAGDRDWFAYVVGLESGDARAGPWSMAAGRSTPEAGEIVLPEMFSRTTGLQLGEHASVADASFTVVGFSRGTFSMANSVVFVDSADLEEILSTSSTVSFMLVDAAPGVDPGELAARIEAEVEKVSARTQEQFLKSDFELAMRMGVEIIFFMTVIGTLLAIVIVAFSTFVQVSRRFHELAVTKALGFTNRSIYASVMLQGVAITAVGFVLAGLVAAVAIPVLASAVPQVIFVLSPAAVARMGAIAVVVAALASLVPARLVSSVDPVSAFKA